MEGREIGGESMGIKVKCEEQTFEAVHIEEGIYPAVLRKIESRKINVKTSEGTEERDILQWDFDVEAEEGTVSIQGITSMKFSTGRNPSKFYRWACALLGRKIKPGEEIDTDELIGRDCVAIVEDRKVGDAVVSRVADIKRARKKKAKKAAKKAVKKEEEEAEEEEVEEEVEEEELEA